MQTLHNVNKGGGEAREGEEPWGLECGREWECEVRRGECGEWGRGRGNGGRVLK